MMVSWLCFSGDGKKCTARYCSTAVMSNLYVVIIATLSTSGVGPFQSQLYDSTAFVEFGSRWNTPLSISEKAADSIPTNDNEGLGQLGQCYGLSMHTSTKLVILL